jgi:hypothetical protein
MTVPTIIVLTIVLCCACDACRSYGCECPPEWKGKHCELVRTGNDFSGIFSPGGGGDRDSKPNPMAIFLLVLIFTGTVSILLYTVISRLYKANAIHGSADEDAGEPEHEVEESAPEAAPGVDGEFDIDDDDDNDVIVRRKKTTTTEEEVNDGVINLAPVHNAAYA